MARSRKSLLILFKSFLPDVGAAVRRFPLAALTAAVFTLLHLFDADRAFGLDSDAWMRVSFGLGAAFLWSMGASLYAERARWSAGKRLIAELAGVAVIAALYALPLLFSFQPQLFFAGLAIVVGLAPYLRAGSAPNAAFWQFNHHLWLGAGLALLGAALFAGGLSLIIETLELLFEFEFPSGSHDNIWTVGVGFIAPLNWLSLAPADFGEQVREGEQDEFTSRAVAVIVKYILVPLLLVYTAILYAYAVKIGLDGVLPKGRLGPMVLAYGAIGTLTVLFAWPTRRSAGPLVALFWRHWFWLTLGPVVLLFLAAYQRIAQYGVTEERYLVVVAGVWLAVLALWFLLRRGARDLRILPAGLCLALLVASLGPWGAVGVSVRSQTSELASLLETHGRLKDGQLAAGKAGDLPREASSRAASILRYLRRHNRLDIIAGWFDASDNGPFRAGLSKDETAREVARLIGASRHVAVPARADNVNFQANRPMSMSLAGFDRILGPVEIGRRIRKIPAGAGDETQPGTSLEGAAVTFIWPDGREMRFDLREAMRKAAELKPEDIRLPLEVPAQADGRPRGLLVITTMWGRANDDFTDVRRLRGWLLLKTE